MPTIRVDDEVYRWLQSQAIPFEDNPNSVLRRLARIAGYRKTSDPIADPDAKRILSTRISEQGLIRRVFFQRLIDELREKHKFTNIKKGTTQPWQRLGSDGSAFVYYIAFMDTELRTWVNI